MKLTEDENKRYDRHLKLPGFGLEKQLKLKQARVLIVGAGGLGCPIALYLAAAGVGNIVLVDDDKIELSNLQRQIAFSVEQIGQDKASVLAQRMRELNPLINVCDSVQRLDTNNIAKIIAAHDLVIDGTDNFATRFLVADKCYLQKITYLHAAVYQYQGQIAVFGPGEKPCFRCLFSQAPGANALAPCAEAGILGVITGSVGTIAAVEAIKYLTGIGESMAGKVLTYNALNQQLKTFTIEPDAQCALCSQNSDLVKLQKSYQANCVHSAKQTNDMERIELKEQIISQAQAADLLRGNNSSEEIFLLDVREEKEFKEGHIEGAVLWPLSILRSIPIESLANEFKTRLPRSSTKKEKQIIICYCQHGVRSLKAVSMLREAGIDNIISLEGGFEDWQALPGVSCQAMP